MEAFLLPHHVSAGKHCVCVCLSLSRLTVCYGLWQDKALHDPLTCVHSYCIGMYCQQRNSAPKISPTDAFSKRLPPILTSKHICDPPVLSGCGTFREFRVERNLCRLSEAYATLCDSKNGREIQEMLSRPCEVSRPSLPSLPSKIHHFQDKCLTCLTFFRKNLKS